MQESGRAKKKLTRKILQCINAYNLQDYFIPTNWILSHINNAFFAIFYLQKNKTSDRYTTTQRNPTKKKIDYWTA